MMGRCVMGVLSCGRPEALSGLTKASDDATRAFHRCQMDVLGAIYGFAWSMRCPSVRSLLANGRAHDAGEWACDNHGSIVHFVVSFDPNHSTSL